MVDDKVDKVPSTSTSVDPTSSNWARPVLTNARLAVEVFDGTGHFGMWQSEVLDTLFQQGLDIFIEESKPEDVEERNWLTINQLACGTIRSCLSREQRYAFSKETSAYKLWVALEEKFLKKYCQNKLFMKKRLFRFTYVPGTIMNDHITIFNQLVTDLVNMDEDDVSLSKVCAALYSKELRRKDKQISSSGDAEILLVIGRSQKKGTDKRRRSKSRQKLSKDECAFCHEKGHWKRDCLRLKTKDNHYKRKAVAEANVTKCDDKESDLSLATSSSRNASEIWLLDSACSHYNTQHREWFSNFEEHEKLVYTTDETPLTTHGIGSVRLQNEDGTIVTLKGVRYSLKLKKNLISIGTLESKGFEVRAKHKVMKIISGVLIVMKGIRKISNTYTYKGRTVIGTIATVTDGDRNSEVVKLWHMRLGHAGEKSLNLLIKQGLLKGAEAVTYACHLVNRFPSTAIDGKTPFEKWYGKPATDYDSLHVFGSATYYHVKESKLDPREKKALFTGITSKIKGYCLWCPEIKKTIFSRDVTFNESAMLKKVNAKQLDGTSKKVEFERIIIPADREPDDNYPMVEGDYEEEKVQSEEPRQQQHESIATSKPKRNTKRPARLNDTVACASSIAVDDVPTTYSEAVRDSENEKWRIAMSDEMQSLQKNQTWELTNLQKGGRQLDATGSQLDLELVQMDVKTTFLHGDLEGEIYMVQPEGFKVAGKEHEVCNLHKLFYGLKQSPRQWYKRFDKFMMDLKYTRSKYDHCVSFKKLQDGSFIYLFLYIDDMLIASQSLDEIERLKTQLKSKFKMKDLGEAKMILGIEIVTNRILRKICLTQKQYLRRVLKRFRFDKQTKRVSTPLASQFKISAAMSSKNDAERAYVEKVPYANAVALNKKKLYYTQDLLFQEAMDSQSTQTIKLPILQPENGNAPIVTKTVDGKETVIPPTIVKDKAQRSQPSIPQLDNEDLQQIYPDDLEEMNLRPKFNTARPKAVLNDVQRNHVNVVKASARWVCRPKHKVLDHVSRNNGASMSFRRFDYGNPQQDLKDKGVIDSGCSRHMTGNRSYLTDYKEINGGFVTFGGNSKEGKIIRKGKIRTDFKLTNESRSLLKVSRKDNMYSVDLKNVVPQGGLTCLLAKATSDESNLCYRRLEHVNFKTINNLVKGNLGRQADTQAEIYNIDLDHSSKVFSMQEDDAEVQEAVEIVTTKKLMTEVVTAAATQVVTASTPIHAAMPAVVDFSTPISAAKPAAKPKVLKIIFASPAVSTRKRKGVVIRDPEEELHDDTLAETLSVKDKGKGIAVEDPKPMKKKDQIEMDAEYAKKLQEEEESFRKVDWNTAFDYVQAKGIQYIKRYHGYKKKPHSESEAYKNMIAYLKNTEGFKMAFFKGKTYDQIRPIFQARFDANMRFLLKSREEMEKEEEEIIKSINETPP
nr:retrovirus-related Pol polyprotein from transposon TNT 1-94 [Tanacetum cinerariifolium]